MNRDQYNAKRQFLHSVMSAVPSLPAGAVPRMEGLLGADGFVGPQAAAPGQEAAVRPLAEWPLAGARIPEIH